MIFSALGYLYRVSLYELLPIQVAGIVTDKADTAMRSDLLSVR